MASPFPGMDPYLEDPDLWPDVHARLIVGIGEFLTPKLRPRYVARVEQRTFLFDLDDEGEELFLVPDARIVQSIPHSVDPFPTVSGGTMVAERTETATPIDVTGLVVKGAVQRFLEIRDQVNRQVVTVIELLSPSNKIKNSSGRRALLQKRRQVGSSAVNWLEVDLLRCGSRTMTFARMPKSAYFAYADRTTTEGRQQLAWPIGLRELLPRLPVPLRPGEPDVTLDLQTVLDAAYDRAAYDLEFDYALPPNPPLAEDNARWADALLLEKKLRG